MIVYPRKNIFILLSTTLFFYGCSTTLTAPKVNYSSYKINTTPFIDSSYTLMLKPYRDSLNKTMNEVIGFSTNGLTKKQPESGLGNFMVDAIKIMAEKKLKSKIDAAFVNFGGIRTYIPRGDVTVGKIFELMPFDNIIVVQTLSGNQLISFLNIACEKGGWPVSYGLTYSIKDKKLSEVLINNKPIDLNASYIIANSDYIANGGDNCEVLKAIPKQSLNYLIRDALLDYTKLLTAEGKPINANIENRVTYAK